MPLTLSPEDSVLVILMGSLGDVARGLMLVEPIKRAIPHGKLSWLVEPACEALVRSHPLIDQVIVFQRNRWVSGIPELVRSLRSNRFNVALDMQRHLKSGLFAALSGAPIRVGFHRGNSKEGNFLFQTATIPPFPLSTPKQRMYLSFLQALDLPLPAPGDYGLRRLQPTQGVRELRARIGGEYAAIVLGSSWPSKDWPRDGYLSLIPELHARYGLKSLLIGGRNEQDLGRDLHRAHAATCVDSSGTTDLPTLCGLLQNAAVGVGPDSGPGHLCSLLGTPYVSLFGPTSPLRTAPPFSEAYAIPGRIGCSPCYLRRCPGLDRLCMRLISVQAVLEVVERALRKPQAMADCL